jgi:Ca2+-binding EF-hand superfamily protein
MMIAQFDTNADGVLQAEEIAAIGTDERATRMLERADTDGDGQISEAEFDTGMDRMGGRHGWGGHQGRGDGHRG